MNDFIKTLIARRSIRAYLPEQVREEDLAQILEAGTYAACGKGAQSGKIVVVQDKPTLTLLERLNAAAMGKPDAKPFYGAPMVCVVLADTSIPTYLEDGSLIMGNLMAAAHSLGVGSCWDPPGQKGLRHGRRQGPAEKVGHQRKLCRRGPLHPGLSGTRPGGKAPQG